MAYSIEVVGTTWEGFKGAYVYQAKELPVDGIHLAERIKRIAGDFSAVDDYRVIRTTFSEMREGIKRISTKVEETLKDWNDENSEAIFMGCMGGYHE